MRSPTSLRGSCSGSLPLASVVEQSPFSGWIYWQLLNFSGRCLCSCWTDVTGIYYRCNERWANWVSFSLKTVRGITPGLTDGEISSVRLIYSRAVLPLWFTLLLPTLGDALWYTRSLEVGGLLRRTEEINLSENSYPCLMPLYKYAGAEKQREFFCFPWRVLAHWWGFVFR